MEGTLRQQLRSLFQVFKQSELLDYLEENGHLITLPPSTVLLDAEQYIKAIPLLLEGLIRVYREDQQGREVLLYYISPGQSCAMTLASSLQNRRSSIKAIIEQESVLLALPVDSLYELGFRFPSWQNFVAATFTLRFEEVLQVIEGIAFHRLDERLQAYLQQKAELQATRALSISHQQIADDLATSREVISRLLKQLELLGHIKLERGKITIL